MTGVHFLPAIMIGASLLLTACTGNTSPVIPLVLQPVEETVVTMAQPDCPGLHFGDRLAANVAPLLPGPRCDMVPDPSGKLTLLYSLRGNLSQPKKSGPNPPDFVLFAQIYITPKNVADLPPLHPDAKKPSKNALQLRAIGQGQEAALSGNGITIREIASATDPYSDINYACVIAARPYRLRLLQVMLCRPVGHRATDDAVRAAARRIITEDLPEISIEE